MSTRRRLITGGMFNFLNHWPVASKMLLLVLVPLGLTLAATQALTTAGLNRLEADTSTHRLQEEVTIIGQQFNQVEDILSIAASQLTADPHLLQAVELGDVSGQQSLLLAISLRLDLDHVGLIDADGRTLSARNSFDLQAMSPEMERLHSLGLLQISATSLVPTSSGWLLTTVRPFKSQAGLVVGVLSLGRLLDEEALLALNFERPNPRLVVFDAQGNMSAVSGANAEGEAHDLYEVDPDLWASAAAGQTQFGQARIAGELQRVAYAPLVVDDQTAAVFGVVLSTAAASSLRNQLVATNLAVAAIIVVVAALAAVGLGRIYVVRPIAALVSIAQKITAGQLDVAMPSAANRDEIGKLAATFNTMTAQLVDSARGLEQRVNALAASAEIGHATTQIRNLDDLLRQSLNLIRDRFAGIYHASVFLVDESGRNAVLRDSTGEVGALLRTSGYSLEIGSQSLVGWVTANRQPRVAMDVGEDPFYLKDERLPNTRAEAAFPLVVGGNLLGVLDVQSLEPNAFTPDLVQVLQTVADQLSVAIENAQLFQRAQASLAEVSTAYQRVVGGGWRGLARNRPQETVYQIESRAEGAAEPPADEAPLLIPLRLHGEVIATMEIHGRSAEGLGEDERAILNTVSAQLGVALEGAVLFEESQRRTRREQIITQIADQMRTTLDQSSVVQNGIRELGRALGASEVVVKLTPSRRASDEAPKA